MVFVDDTGHEEFADPNYPVFGFGGCTIPAFARLMCWSVRGGR
jgi:hypothetical protein